MNLTFTSTVIGKPVYIFNDKASLSIGEEATRRKLLEGQNLTKLAQRLGIHRSSLSKIKHGHIPMPDLIYHKLISFVGKKYEN